MRKSPNVQTVLPLLYLKGLSGNAFQEALGTLLGEDAAGLSKSSISSLKASWAKEMDEWRRRKIEEDFVYLWCDGVNVNVRLGENKRVCLLVVMGVTTLGEKRLLAVEDGYRESAESWRVVFRSLVERGLNNPHLIVGDGALGLWAAIDCMPEFRATKKQRCWVHKIANVLDKLSKKMQPQAKYLLHEMMNSSCEEHAGIARNIFVKSFGPKYPKAVHCLVKDWDLLVTFFSFPARHWKNIRTTNPIESTFATVKLRTKVTKGAGNCNMAVVMAFKLMREAEKKWICIGGHGDIQNLILGNIYKDGQIVDAAEIAEDSA